ncbi:hypothetical protein PTTG_28864 [Puccinia triticina 1-1 BBBD Race 1]|uniref:Restriction of telomere capping protein 4 n=1 Tax=Puccinia triticina (isolate 1-1 / race 1 (BBBD)) TaxID=630390 RepID=A0A180G8I3_PUCT1|nr:hypothetical protein PTTG_28864 [Puccinia triticina 1-1 BBBD Race 1]
MPNPSLLDHLGFKFDSPKHKKRSRSKKTRSKSLKGPTKSIDPITSTISTSSLPRRSIEHQKLTPPTHILPNHLSATNTNLFEAPNFDLLEQMTQSLQARGICIQSKEMFAKPSQPKENYDDDDLPAEFPTDEAQNQEILSNPLTRFLKLNKYLKGVPEVKFWSGSSNPAALHLLFPRIAEHCQLHRAETTLIPMGISRGWPIHIDFEILPTCVQNFKLHLEKVYKRKVPSDFMNSAVELWQSCGRQRVQSVVHDFSNFHMEQPGYYGVRGYQIILGRLKVMFKNETLPLAPPLSNDFLLRKVLLPEVASCLIAEDMNTDVANQKVQLNLEESWSFGAILFPDPDKD